MAGHSLVPWSKIYQYFISSESVSYSDCAAKFHVSLVSVKKHGSAESWVQKKKDVFKAALTMMESRTSELIARRNTQHIELAKKLLNGAEKQLAEGILPKSARDVKDWIATGVAIERTSLGMDQKAGGGVSITDPRGTTFKVSWGDGSPLDEH